MGMCKALVVRGAAAAWGVKTCLLLSAPDAVSFYQVAGYMRDTGKFVFVKGS
jgi:hypothetical protein